MQKIAVNGLGRIGRCVSRILLDSGNLVAINSNKLTPKNAAYMLQYDSIHGRLESNLSCTESSIIYKGSEIRISDKSNLDQMNWQGVDIVLECSGVFNSKDQAYNNIKNIRLGKYIKIK